MSLEFTVTAANCSVLREVPENEANTALIAAAPELYDALRRISDAHNTGNNGAVMGEAVLCKMFASMANAALAKAEGKA